MKAALWSLVKIQIHLVDTAKHSYFSSKNYLTMNRRDAIIVPVPGN